MFVIVRIIYHRLRIDAWSSEKGWSERSISANSRKRKVCLGGVIYFIIIMTHFFIFIINKDILTTIYSHSFRLPFKGVIGCWGCNRIFTDHIDVLICCSKKEEQEWKWNCIIYYAMFFRIQIRYFKSIFSNSWVYDSHTNIITFRLIFVMISFQVSDWENNLSQGCRLRWFCNLWK